MAASCIRLASILLAIIFGVAIILALSIIIASHSTCPKHLELPLTFE